MLEQEYRCFEAALPGLLRTSRGQFVLIHQDNVEGTWRTENEAYTEGCKRFGSEPFLVMLIDDPEPPRPVYQELVRCPFPLGN